MFGLLSHNVVIYYFGSLLVYGFLDGIGSLSAYRLLI